MKYYKIFFSILFFTLLIVPLTHIDHTGVSEMENRSLAEFPQYFANGSLNSNFGKEFESWISDRFWGRSAIIDLNFKFRYNVNNRIENERAFVGADGWMFRKSGSIDISSVDYQKDKVLQKADIIRKINTYFEEKQIPFYVFILPRRSMLYQRYYTGIYDVPPRLDGGKLLKELLSDETNIHVIDFGEEKYINNDIEYYYKEDSHLTPEALQYFTAEIIKEVSGLDNVEIVKEELKSQHRTNIARTLGLSVYTNKYKLVVKTGRYWKVKEVKYAKGVILGLFSSLNARIDNNIYIIDGCYISYAFDVWGKLYKHTAFLRGNFGFPTDNKFELFKDAFNEFITNISDGVGVMVITSLISGDEFNVNFQKLFAEQNNDNISKEY